jgi:type VI secretion system secreted protein VgrG
VALSVAPPRGIGGIVASPSAPTAATPRPAAVSPRAPIPDVPKVPQNTNRVDDHIAEASTSRVKTGLGDNVDRLTEKSPSLQKDLKMLQENGWSIKYALKGAGSTCNRADKLILIDGADQDNPERAIQNLAHEVGHATNPFKPDYSSREAYLKSTLGDEGAATLNNIKVQREILANKGPDIGIAGNAANHAKYNEAYDQFLEDGDATKARNAVGKIFGNGEKTSNTGQSYADYYGGWYDKIMASLNRSR